MTDIKWIKISTEMFSDEKIKVIEAMPEADTVLLIWIKLLSLAGRTNAGGYIFLTEDVPYTEDTLSTVMGRPKTVVSMALTIFVKFKMIIISDNGYLLISNWERYQNVDGMERIRALTAARVQSYRGRRKEVLGLTGGISKCAYCGGNVTGFDHVVPVTRGGTDAEDNKVFCCLECNRMKNNRPLIEFLNGNRDRINDDLILNNPKLTRYVTLRNATDRYTVTNVTHTDIELRTKNKKKELSTFGIDVCLQTSTPSVTENPDPFKEPEKPKPDKPKKDSPNKRIKFDRTPDIKDAKFIGITEGDIDVWIEAYPAVNFTIEVKKAIAWIYGAGPQGYKSKWYTFLNGWFNRTQNSGGTK